MNIPVFSFSFDLNVVKCLTFNDTQCIGGFTPLRQFKALTGSSYTTFRQLRYAHLLHLIILYIVSHQNVL